jgi:hypothetical protein
MSAPCPHCGQSVTGCTNCNKPISTQYYAIDHRWSRSGSDKRRWMGGRRGRYCSLKCVREGTHKLEKMDIVLKAEQEARHLAHIHKKVETQSITQQILELLSEKDHLGRKAPMTLRGIASWVYGTKDPERKRCRAMLAKMKTKGYIHSSVSGEWMITIVGKKHLRQLQRGWRMQKQGQ